MPRLEDVRDYLDNRLAVVTYAEKGLEALQEKYETFFAEISRAREHELDQLVESTVQRPRELPAWYQEAVERERVAVEEELHHEREKLLSRRSYRRRKAEGLRRESIQAEERLAAESRERDASEQELEERIAVLKESLEGLEGEIRSLSRGLGFFTNFFKMRRTDRRRRELDRERRRLAGELEALRRGWQDHVETARREEEERRAGWIEAETEAAALSARIEALELERPRIVARSVVERVLGARETTYPEAAEGDPPCPRCRMPNPSGAAFCHICAIRLKEDRPDFEGSLEEITELNLHHRRFAEGMRASQETLALMRGIRSGIEALQKSVREMITARDAHKLGPLDLSIPQSSWEYGRLFDEIAALVRDDIRLHPLIFSGWVRQVTEGRISVEQLTAYFEGIGEELSRAADRGWR